MPFADHGVPDQNTAAILDEAFTGGRGKKFIGTNERFPEAAGKHGAMQLLLA